MSKPVEWETVGPALYEALKRLKACYEVSHSAEQRKDCWDQAFAALALVEREGGSDG